MSDKNTGSRKPNRLARESSPYLLQHAFNPVDWFPWSEEALERARRENRLIFLSIGYSSCHWCHVMERESFEDERIAGLLNNHFVNIKVDREERPDVDAVYMEALQMMTGHGGWPLNVWLTPDQVPIFAGTYFPPGDIHGRPGFPTVVARLAQIWEQQPDKVRKQAAEMQKALETDIYDHLEPGLLTDEHLQRAFQGYLRSFDEVDGGFSAAPKFPTAMGIGFLLRFGLRSVSKHDNPAGQESSGQSGDDAGHTHDSADSNSQAGSNSQTGSTGLNKAHHMALFSLEKMISGGIYDQIGGGFHRYSTDTRWLVPHFEKMLYDNALLLTVLAESALITGSDLYRRTVSETIGFLNREMRHPDGAYYSALDADTEGEEGKFYTFTRDEIGKVLDEDLSILACEHYGVQPGGNWEGVSVLHRVVPLTEIAQRQDTSLIELQQKLDTARQQLLDYRNRRERPGLDDKIITSWNALMLIALCRCSRLLDHNPDDAVRLGTFLADKVMQGNTLYRIIDSKGNARQPGFLDDYALLADAFSQLFELTGELRWLNRSALLVRDMLSRFHDSEKNAFRLYSSDGEQLIARPRDLFDNAQPGGSTAAITALYRVGLLAGKPEWIRIAVDAMEPLAEIAAAQPNAFGYLLQTMHRHIHPGKEIVIVPAGTPRPAADPVARRMLEIWRERFDPGTMVITLPPGTDPTTSGYPAPYAGKTALDNRTTAWVCESFHCRLPVHTPADFYRELLA
jgi:uncharacterized protein